MLFAGENSYYNLVFFIMKKNFLYVKKKLLLLFYFLTNLIMIKFLNWDQFSKTLKWFDNAYYEILNVPKLGDLSDK